jgi:hypothetical protein
LCASGGGHHSHDHPSAHKSPDDNTIRYRDSQDGVDAYLEFHDLKRLTGDDPKSFFARCQVGAYLIDSQTGEDLEPTKILLRATIGHDQFGEAVIFTPADDQKMAAELFVKHRGEYHYLLIAEIEGVGVKEFHFHHTF